MAQEQQGQDPQRGSQQPDREEFLPILKRPGVLSQAKAEGWQSLLTSNSFCMELKHHCPICYQWMASAPGLKRHMHRHHSEWNHHMPSLLQLTKVIKGDITRPCKFCRASSFDKGRRWNQCPVILGAAFIQCYHQAPAIPVGQPYARQPDARHGPSGTGQTGARAFLREAEPAAGHDSEGGRQDGARQATENRGREPEAQARQSPRQGRTKRQQTLQELWESGRAGRAPANGCEVSPAPRPGYPDDQTRYVLSHLCPDRAGLDHPFDVSGRQQVEGDQGKESCGTHIEFEGDPDAISAGRNESEARSLQGPARLHRVCAEPTVDEQRWGMALCQVGPLPTEADSSAAVGHDDHTRNLGRHYLDQPGASPHGSQISPGEATVRTSGGGHGTVRPGNITHRIHSVLCKWVNSLALQVGCARKGRPTPQLAWSRRSGKHCEVANMAEAPEPSLLADPSVCTSEPQ